MNKLSYSEMVQLKSFEERFVYLSAVRSFVGKETFGYERWLNQKFYTAPEWRSLRYRIIGRDNGCDLAIADRKIFGRVFIHHLNPITLEDIEKRSECLMDADNLVCCSFETHNALHYGDLELLSKVPVVREAFDTCPWRRQ